MSSQPAQGWHPNPQLMQQQAQPLHMPPAGWTGSWPPAAGFPPGYPGPPPMPHGAPSRWNAGSWQYNPHMQNGQQPWAPGMGWGMPPNYNPYKRVPRPASPSYWKTELTNNGLGLEGMVKRERKEDQDSDEPHTPWIWSPPSLLADGEDRPRPERTFDLRREGSSSSGIHHARAASTPVREPATNADRRAASYDTPINRSFDNTTANSTPVRPTTTSQPYYHTPDRVTPSRGEYIYRSNSTPHETHHTTAPGRQSTEPARRSSSHQRSSSTGPSSSSHHHSTLTRGESFSTGRSNGHAPPGNQYPAPTTATTSASSTANGRAAQPLMYTQEPDSYSSRAELQPTFSANIVRTPVHYQSPRRSTDEGRHASRSPSRHGPPPSSNQGRGVPSAQPLMRHSSMPTATSSRDPYSNFAEDMSSGLPPVSSAPRSSRSTGPLTRSRTEPSVGLNLTTIPETVSSTSSGDQFFAPLAEPFSSSDESSPDPSPRLGNRRSPYSNDPSPNRSPRARHNRSPYGTGRSPGEPRQDEHRPSPYSSRPSPDPSPRHHDSRRSSSHSNGPSPRTPNNPSPQHRPSPYSNSRRENPLPAPPMERPTLSGSQPPVQESPPANWSRRVRYGFWNRRGDHLTPNLYVVYAPEDRAYPSELRNYPDERGGFQDHHGTFIPAADRPELPASLPQRGRPPAQPYDSFVVYKYFP
ncbi:hypothetical protein F5J12DRAFT_833407 [Pisolithus orientalis]|uniref:uncharacterized protein n=1 Tax=Pisolithus orientalis TaxID=936130 RepID=UPI002224A67E|nr:uncharacterized protein F5J12DRAFT_833407 [Pisolithus orientalis]KAI6006278.1 hypothetical protein F5J12DRAFT_833407 [Pisolithus orientalis]